ncbi:antibiotic biosynthesis monooxygenase [Luteolibacter arcticus]|uniref:Antibiotic biosynthesis monooxygenase n=1 Tax=Luteolibacter arcticus TaxID=1581411 RepID=A0ABT3GQS7_9BACT|nr:antibiotic biosynthesis monooxygenase [Luteolibacter arcticus]MCW1925879.1 antibiotic biosynthesis monooxygenase [Luteolibacter arcticus]
MLLLFLFRRFGLRHSLAALLRKAAGIVMALLLSGGLPVRAQDADTVKRKVLFVVTSHDQKGNTGERTGFYLSEVSHPWAILKDAGYDIDFVSPKGGKAPVEGLDLDDPVNHRFWSDATCRREIESTLKPSDVHPEDYAAIHYAGGHGSMWDFADNAGLAAIAAKIYESGGVVSAVCHGPAGLVNVKLSSGEYLVDGKKVSAFTNEEEAAVKLDRVVPFLLESKLIERGAIFEKADPWQPHVASDQRVVTGQNPQSAGSVGKALLEQLGHRDVAGRLVRYDVKPDAREAFQKALSGYVSEALEDGGNIQAEAYHEREERDVLWLIERWKNRSELDRFQQSPQAIAIEALKAGALAKPAETHHVTDLEPLSKEHWRRAPGSGDRPITIMLFVDSREGTQDEFKTTYHAAMPAFRGQPGVVTYQLSQIGNDDTKFVTFEKFRSDEAFAAHLEFPATKPVVEYLQAKSKTQPFQDGLHTLIEFAPLIRDGGK